MKKFGIGLPPVVYLRKLKTKRGKMIVIPKLNKFLKIWFISLLILSIVFLIFSYKSDSGNIVKNYETITIDGCEYIIIDKNLGEYNKFAMTHKGNCKNHQNANNE